MDSESAREASSLAQPDASASENRTVRALPASARAGYFRWAICALLLFGTTKNYMDRSVIGVLNVTLQQKLGWGEIGYSNLVNVFQIAYALGLLLMGPLIDRVGTRLGYALAMIFWSLASMATALGSSFRSFALSRFALGLGEAGVFPASIKAVAEWFPRKERALATGIFNAGTNIGTLLTPFFVSKVTARWGWRGAFVGVGLLGFVWLVFWLLVYRKPEESRGVSPGELAYIKSDPQESPKSVPWLSLLPLPQTWCFVLAKFLTDPVWWFYLFWVPGFLQRKHGLAVTQLGWPLVVIYVIADVGSVAGGWISSSLLKGGRTLNASRKTAMLLCAVSVIPVVTVYRVERTWTAVLLVGLAAACHQGFSANLFTLASDLFPSRAVGSVVGIGGMAGALGGLLISTVVGHRLELTGSYRVPFFIAGSAYLVGLAVIQMLSPRLQPAGDISS